MPALGEDPAAVDETARVVGELAWVVSDRGGKPSSVARLACVPPLLVVSSAQFLAAGRREVTAAAMRRTTLTYGELAMAIELPPDLPLPHHINRVLRRVADDCIARGEPSLAVIVVNRKTGKPGPGFVDGGNMWFGEAQ